MKKIPPPHHLYIFRFAIVTGCAVLSWGSTTPRCAARTDRFATRVVMKRARELAPPAPIPESAGPDDPIPHQRYKTWSLFLISNPEWLLDQSNDKLNTLYKRFGVFGNAIGPENLAVWFWSQPPEGGELQKAVDVTRSVAICKSLKLKPSEGPYVLVMTEYPGDCLLTDYPKSFPKNSVNTIIIKLNGTDAVSTARLLSDLVVGLVTEDLSKLRPKADDYWSGWRNVFRQVSSAVLDLSSKVTVSLDAGPMKTEIKLGP